MAAAIIGSFIISCAVRRSTLLAVALIAVAGCAGQRDMSPQLERPHCDPLTVPVVNHNSVELDPLSPDQRRKLVDLAEGVSNGREIWFIALQRNTWSKSCGREWAATVYFVPDRIALRVRRGLSATFVISDARPHAFQGPFLTRRATERTAADDESTTLLPTYIQVALKGTADAGRPEVPQGTLDMPFLRAIDLTDDQLVSVVDFMGTLHQLNRIRAAGEWVDPAAPLLSVSRNGDSIEVLNGIIEPPLFLEGQAIVLTTEDGAYRVVSVQPWRRCNLIWGEFRTDLQLP
ncbi:MAG TPA: hypothetical protein P5572_05765 [Phycisphaerae bacterium]|nr:hypothetical protein [Phycisphaerales bacterium]HRX84509.1 hypothetical protein [Phycisphaerae bacterium]